jgi:aryl-alcohol dehydrogenase-like predicted oxidoreductase
MGLGCWAIGGPWRMGDRPAGWGEIDDATSIRAIHAAMDLGVRFFDTAANYGAGHSERVLGLALEGRRDRVVIATKFGHLVDEASKVVRGDNEVLVDNIRRDCERSLARLNTDYIDIYQLHEGRLDPERALAAREVLEELVAEGKIRAYGWSTDDPERARLFAEGEHCTAVQHALNVFHRADRMVALCEAEHLASINKKPLMSGLLTGKYTSEATFPENDHRHGVDLSRERPSAVLARVQDLRDVLTSDGRTLVQGAIGWIWAHHPHTVPIPGFKNVRQAMENAGALQYGPLGDAAMAQIDALVAPLTIQVDER